jgi:hypothetical protein
MKGFRLDRPSVADARNSRTLFEIQPGIAPKLEGVIQLIRGSVCILMWGRELFVLRARCGAWQQLYSCCKQANKNFLLATDKDHNSSLIL